MDDFAFDDIVGVHSDGGGIDGADCLDATATAAVDLVPGAVIVTVMLLESVYFIPNGLHLPRRV